MGLTLERHGKKTAKVSVSRADGREVPVRLRLLGYDGCEFEIRPAIRSGRAGRNPSLSMGCIRARVVCRNSRVVEAEFLKDCPV